MLGLQCHLFVCMIIRTVTLQGDEGPLGPRGSSGPNVRIPNISLRVHTKRHTDFNIFEGVPEKKVNLMFGRKQLQSDIHNTSHCLLIMFM